MSLMIKSQNRIKTKRYRLLLLAVFLFPILPQFIYLIGPINTVNFTVISVIGLFTILGKFPAKKVYKALPFFWTYELFCALYYYVDDGIVKAISWLFSFVIIPYLVVCTIDSEKRFYSVIDALILGGSILDIFGIVEEIFNFNIFQKYAPAGYTFFTYNYRYGLLRIMTTFGQPIGYGIYQVFVIALIIYRLGSNISKKNKTILKVFGFLSVINVLLTVSRTPIIMLILLVNIELFQTTKKRKAKRFLTILIVLFTMILVKETFSIPVQFIDDIVNSIRLIEEGNRSDTSSAGVGQRFELLYWVLVSMNGHWFLGKGIAASFSYRVNDWQTKTSIENGYLDIFYRTGIVGVVFYCSMMIGNIRLLLKNKKTKLPCEKKSFFRIIGTMFVLYMIALFGAQETDITRLFVLFVSLIISYKKICAKY